MAYDQETADLIKENEKLKSCLIDCVDYLSEIDWEYKKQYPSQIREYEELEATKLLARKLTKSA